MTRELVGGVLIPLATILDRLEAIRADYWVLRDIEGHAGRPLGLPLPEFERLTKELVGGLHLAPEDLRALAASDMQVVDGVFEAFCLERGQGTAADSAPHAQCILRLECIDAGEWELETPSKHVAAELGKHLKAAASSG
jgi:hypothetical protein